MRHFLQRCSCEELHSDMAEWQQFCAFFLKQQCFGVPVEQVQEVMRYQEMTRVPLMPAAVRGLINLRGQIVMALDLRRRFDMEEKPATILPMNVVIRCDGGPISLLVDEIGDVLELKEEDLERPPETIHGSARELMRGVYQLPDRLLMVLDCARVAALGLPGDNAR